MTRDGGIRAPVVLVAVGLLGYAAWELMRQQGEPEQGADDGASGGAGGGLLADAGQVLAGAGETAAESVDRVTGGMLKLSAMANVNLADLGSRNVQAMLRVIRTGEGTAGPDGYRTMFGGSTFSSYADHPRVANKRWGLTSTAAGAYQALSSSWDETARIMGLKDFSPESQDLFALGRIAARRALDDVKAGRFEAAIRKLNREWASLPESPYGQNGISWDTARAVFASAGGTSGNMA